MKKKEIIKPKDFSISKNVDNSSKKATKVELRHRFFLGSKCYSVRSVNVTPDDRYLILTNTGNPKIRVVDLELLEYKPEKFNSHMSTVRLTSLTQEGSSFFTASWDGNCHRYDFATGACTAIYDSGGLPMPSCYISRNGRYLFTAHYESVHGLESENRGRCRDLINNKLYEYRHQARTQQPGSIDIVYDGKYVYTGSDDGTAHKWSLKKQTSLIRFFSLPLTVRKIAVTKKYFLAGCTDGIVRIYYKSTGKKYKEIVHNPSREVLDIKVTGDESKLVSASSDGTIMCVNLHSAKVIFHKQVHFDWIWSIHLFKNDHQIVSGSIDGTVAIMNINGDILARYFNLTTDDFLIACPKDKKDKIFPNGCFFTTNDKLISVFHNEKTNSSRNVLAEDDKNRLEYINGLNRKNVIIAKLKNNNSYQKLAENHRKNKELLNDIENLQSTKYLLEAPRKSFK